MTEPEQEKPDPEAVRTRLEAECAVEFFVAGGPGGQHRNRTATGVRLRHRPTGVVVSATERRSQHQNLEAAYERLERRLAELRRPRKKRVPTRPGPGAERRRLEAKRKLGRKKQARGREPEDGE